MIVPLVDEDVWLRHLQGLPTWEPPLTQTLILSPHPDDETLGAGGLIASLRSKGVSVSVAAVTDGENAYADNAGLAETRVAEQNAALARLGVEAREIYRFGLADSDVSASEERLVELLLPLVSRQTHIVAPWQGDFHPDHEACGRAAERVARITGAQLTWYFFWTWHRGTPALLDGLSLVSFALREEELRAKREALLCHHSQLNHPGGEPILPADLLGPAHRPFEVYLPA